MVIVKMAGLTLGTTEDLAMEDTDFNDSVSLPSTRSIVRIYVVIPSSYEDQAKVMHRR